MLVPPNVFAESPFAGFFEFWTAIRALGSSRAFASSAHFAIDLRLRCRSKQHHDSSFLT
jgi:hypothetical protein